MSGVIALIGLRASGKSSIGPELARELGVVCEDLDQHLLELARDRGLVDATAGVGRVLTECGEAIFRSLEVDALRAALSSPAPMVLACGGGVVESPEALELLEGRARCVWLDPPLGVLVARLRSEPGERPPLLGMGDAADELAELDRRRRPKFERLADLRVTGVLDPPRAARLLGLALAGRSLAPPERAALGLEACGPTD